MSNRRKRSNLTGTNRRAPLPNLVPQGNRAARRLQEREAMREHRHAVQEAQRTGSPLPLPPIVAKPRSSTQRRKERENAPTPRISLPSTKNTTRVLGTRSRGRKASPVTTALPRGIATTRPIVARRVDLPKPTIPLPSGGSGMTVTLVISGSVIVRRITPANSSISSDTFDRWEMISSGKIPPNEPDYKPVTEDEIYDREEEELRNIDRPARAEIEGRRGDAQAEIRRKNAAIEQYEDDASSLERRAEDYEDDPYESYRATSLREEAEELRRLAQKTQYEAEELFEETKAWISQKSEEVREARAEARADIVRWAERENEQRAEDMINELRAGLMREIVSEVSRSYLPGVSECTDYTPG